MTRRQSKRRRNQLPQGTAGPNVDYAADQRTCQPRTSASRRLPRARWIGSAATRLRKVAAMRRSPLLRQITGDGFALGRAPCSARSERLTPAKLVLEVGYHPPYGVTVAGRFAAPHR